MAAGVLNLMAYAHAIPVIDGGILVRTIKGERTRGAEWVAQVAAPTRRCLECLGQYDPGLVSAEREGYFDRPSYIAGLPEDHPIKRNENVFIFGVADASLEALQFLSLAVAPGGISNVGAQTYTAAAGRLSSDYSPCLSTCLYSAPTSSVAETTQGWSLRAAMKPLNRRARPGGANKSGYPSECFARGRELAIASSSSWKGESRIDASRAGATALEPVLTGATWPAAAGEMVLPQQPG